MALTATASSVSANMKYEKSEQWTLKVEKEQGNIMHAYKAKGM
jgi:hypothetical protein